MKLVALLKLHMIMQISPWIFKALLFWVSVSTYFLKTIEQDFSIVGRKTIQQDFSIVGRKTIHQDFSIVDRKTIQQDFSIVGRKTIQQDCSIMGRKRNLVILSQWFFLAVHRDEKKWLQLDSNPEPLSS